MGEGYWRGRGALERKRGRERKGEGYLLREKIPENKSSQKESKSGMGRGGLLLKFKSLKSVERVVILLLLLSEEEGRGREKGGEGEGEGEEEERV
jgi:hypothetical protein